MADSSRPRPKPRPKPKPKASSSQVESGTSAIPGSPSSPQLASSSSRATTVQDGDDMFIRNRKRSFQTWMKLEEINKETKHIIVDSDEDSENGASPSRKHKKKRQEREVPRWQRDKDFVRMLSQEVSDDSDDDVVILGGTTTPGGRKQLKQKGKRRSRSRSITPPPALPLHQIQNARNVVRQTLDTAPRAASPTYADFDDSTDTITFDPELERIARNITSQAQLHVPAAASSQPSDEVMLSVKWQPHPLNEAGKEDVWQFKMNMDDNFHELFEAVAEEASILTDSLIMSYNGNRIFSSVTPQALKIWGEAELVACDKTTYDYIRKNPQTTAYTIDERPSTTIDIPSSDEDDGPRTSPPLTSQSQSQSHPFSQTHADSDAESESDDDKLKLTFRSSITPGKDIMLTVRSTTKCGAIVKAFLKKAGVAEQYPGVFADAGNGSTSAKKAPAKKGRKSKGAAPLEEKDPRLFLDGDKLDNDSQIGDMDLEDGDLVEVVGL